LNTSPYFHDVKQVREYCNSECDTVFVGSDQVFRISVRDSSWVKKDDSLSVYWMPWDKNQGEPIRISLAASAGATPFGSITQDLKKEACRCINNFDLVSVRDNWTRKCVTELSNGNVEPLMCPDPVWGLNDVFNIPIEEHLDMDVSKTIFVSSGIPGKWGKLFKEIANDKGYLICNLPDPDDNYVSDYCDTVIDFPLSPLNWYYLLSRAAGYVGGRFHGWVSSSTNETPAVSIDISRKPKFSKSTSRTYWVCKEADVTKRYQPMNLLWRPKPSKIFDLLMDDYYQKKVNQFAATASSNLNRVFDTSLECAK